MKWEKETHLQYVWVKTNYVYESVIVLTLC